MVKGLFVIHHQIYVYFLMCFVYWQDYISGQALPENVKSYNFTSISTIWWSLGNRNLFNKSENKTFKVTKITWLKFGKN